MDMGVAALTAFAERSSPEETTIEDLERFAGYAEDAYLSPALSGYLSVLFTKNFYPINPSLKSQPEKVRKCLGDLLMSFRLKPDPGLPPCTYCGRPSVKIPLPKITVAFRDLVPMLTGRDVVNFFPGGRAGLPLCGLCILAVQAVVVGAPLISGKALVISSEDPALTLALVKKWLPETRQRVHLSLLANDTPPKLGRPKTRLVEALVSLQTGHIREKELGLVAYHLSNSGQGPSVDIHELPSSVVKFVMAAKAARYRQAWNDIVRRAWEVPRTTGKAAGEDGGLARRNYLYEDLFELPEQAAAFVRTYLLQRPPDKARRNDPRASYGGWRDARYVKWDLTGLFLKEVVGMDKDRLEAIKRLGDRIAEEIISTNDKGLWRDVYYNCWKPDKMRATLIKHSSKCIKAGKEPLVRLEPYLEIFEEGEEVVRADWRFAWDLVLIRVIERLYDGRWFDGNEEALEPPEDISPAEEA
ncbi:MAG TPA: type I-B CRISPR-associated protein Cas8b1/Cst1 [Deltaproteobacteria bacterium]|nr:type I-B CRISPR-associated protein Cas8b1/Cst1 [Deltaproteobacteria bacterium]